MTRPIRSVAWLTLVVAACSQPAEPVDDSLPAQVSAYHYKSTRDKRYFELSPLPDTCGGCMDTLVDSVWRVFTENGIFWSQSYRFIRHFDTVGGVLVPVGDENRSSRREGILGDSLVLDPSLLYKLLITPVQAGRTWYVDDSSTILATIAAEETLLLGIGKTRTWHVVRGAVGDEWWAPGLGRVQYEEISSGQRRMGRLIAVGTIP